MRGKALALTVAIVFVALAVSWWAFGRGSCAKETVLEKYTSGDVVGFQLDRAAEPAVVAAIDKMMQSANWLGCVPAIQLEKVARGQASTGVSTIKAGTILEVMKTRKNDTLARIQRLGISPTFKAGLVQYAEYVLSAFTDMVNQYTNKDGYVDLAKVADSLKDFRGGYCANLPRNFGTGNSFLPATG